MQPWMKYFRCAKVKLRRPMSDIVCELQRSVPVVDETPDETAQSKTSPEATHGIANNIGVGVLSNEALVRVPELEVERRTRTLSRNVTICDGVSSQISTLTRDEWTYETLRRYLPARRVSI